MLARCFRCQHTFETERFGIQTCPSCGSEIYLPDPSAPPAAAAPPDAPRLPTPPPLPPLGAGGPGWGPPPPGWNPAAGPPPGWGPLPPGAVPPAAEQSAPFAERDRRGFVASYVETWKLAAVDPGRFFRQVRVNEVRSALLFGTIAITIGNWVALVVSYLTASATMSFFAQLTRRFDGRVDTAPLFQMIQGFTLPSLIGQLVATPLLALLGIYFSAGVFHLLLLVVRGAPRGFDATLTVVAYASGIFLLRALPVCGGLIALVWFIVMVVHGIAEAQRCGTGKAAFAVLGPLVLLCVLACLAAVVAGLAGVAGLRGLGGGAPAPPGTGI
jgi:predicted  nucleic acid-binding Zn-ribbon protein